MADDPQTFSRLRLRGGRYEQPGMPLAALPELTRYERLLVDVAKALWRRRNPDRVRLPAGFEAQLQLRLTRVEGGSVTPVLERTVSDATQPLEAPVESSLHGRARELVEETVASISAGGDIPADFPVEALPGFGRFGSTLRGNESIEFLGTSGRPAVLTQQVRRRLLSRTSVEHVEVETTLLGKIVSLDTVAQSFDIQVPSGRTLAARYRDEGLTADLLRVLDQASLASVVRFDCVALVRADGNEVARVEDVWGLEVFESADRPWSRRLVELAALQPGWLDGAGAAVSVPALELAQVLLKQLSEAALVTPKVYPMPDGGVQLEWQVPRRVTSVEVSPDLAIEVYSVDVETQEDSSTTVGTPAAAAESLRTLLAPT